MIFALIDFNFLVSQLNTIVQLEDLDVTKLPIALTRNALFFDTVPANCCTLGFHTAFETKVQGPLHFVQTFAFATWPDQGIFVDAQIADVIALSHELSEWMNDPFVNNVVPPWQLPDGSGCGNLLETGDLGRRASKPGFSGDNKRLQLPPADRGVAAVVFAADSQITCRPVERSAIRKQQRCRRPRRHVRHLSSIAPLL